MPRVTSSVASNAPYVYWVFFCFRFSDVCGREFVSRIAGLPYEVLLLIFTLVLWRTGCSQFDRETALTHGRTLIRDRLTIRHVCWQWRQIVDGSPALWIDIRVQRPVHLSMLRDWVKNCAFRPVTIVIDLPEQPEQTVLSVVRTLTPVIGRCTSLEVNIKFSEGARRLLAMIHHPPPPLERLVLRNLDRSTFVVGRQGIFWSSTPLPRLRVLQFSNVGFGLAFPLNFVGLQTLVLRNCSWDSAPTWDDFQALCDNAPLLTRLSVTALQCCVPLSLPDTGFTPLVHLTELEITHLLDSTFIIVLSRMQFPSLRTFVLSRAGSFQVDLLVGCVTALSSTRQLLYHGSYLGSSVLVDLLGIMPAIRTVRVTRCVNEMLDALGDVRRGVVSCPILQHIAVECSPSLFRSFYEKRLAHSNSLQIVAIKFGDKRQKELDVMAWLAERLEVRTIIKFVQPSWSM